MFVELFVCFYLLYFQTNQMVKRKLSRFWQRQQCALFYSNKVKYRKCVYCLHFSDSDSSFPLPWLDLDINVCTILCLQGQFTATRGQVCLKLITSTSSIIQKLLTFSPVLLLNLYTCTHCLVSVSSPPSFCPPQVKLCPLSIQPPCLPGGSVQRCHISSGCTLCASDTTRQ